MTSPLKFERGVFYPFDYLESRLEGVMSLQTFLANLHLDCTGKNRLFQNGLFGDEILQAIEDSAKREKTPETAIGDGLEAIPAPRRPRGRPPKSKPAPQGRITSKELFDSKA